MSRTRYRPVKIERLPQIELPLVISQNWERTVTIVAAEVAHQEKVGPSYQTWWEVVGHASMLIGRISALLLSLRTTDNPQGVHDAIQEQVQALTALCVRWTISHEAQYGRR